MAWDHPIYLKVLVIEKSSQNLNVYVSGYVYIEQVNIFRMYERKCFSFLKSYQNICRQVYSSNTSLKSPGNTWSKQKSKENI